MIEKRIYVAEDGKEFYDEYECKEYEIKSSIKNGDLKDYLFLYDKNGFPLDIERVTEFEIVDYIVIKSVEAYNWLECTMYSYYGYFIPNEYDVEKHNYNCAYYYDEMQDEWINCKDRIKECKEEIDKLEKFLF